MRSYLDLYRMVSEIENRIVCSILRFLKNKLSESSLSDDKAESLEVACQCIESSFDVTMNGKSSSAVDLIELFSTHVMKETKQPVISEEAKRQADEYKQQGNDYMKMEQFDRALESYSKAISINPNNPVYYCNRSAAYLKMDKPELCISDCKKALELDQNYSKAYARSGAAYLALKNYPEAIKNLKKASSLDPTNESAQQNLKLAEELAGSSASSDSAPTFSSIAGVDLTGVLQNPSLMNLATQMMSNPAVQQMMGNLLSGMATQSESAQSSLSDLLTAGQRIADVISQVNPELVEELRRRTQPQSTNESGNS